MDLPDGQLEWLESGRFGSFALGCVDRRLRRKYHALLTVREPGRGDAWNVLADVHEHVTHSDTTTLLCDVVSGARSDATLVGFSTLPTTLHRYRLGSGADAPHVTRTVRLEGDQVTLQYRLEGARGPVRLALEPLLRCRALHALTFENPFLDGSCVALGDDVFRMHPYAGMPAVAFRIETERAGERLGSLEPVRFEQDGTWLTDVHYPWEAERGYDADEHLFCPGRFVVALPGDARVTLSVALEEARPVAPPASVTPAGTNGARMRLSFGDKLARAARAYFMQTRAGDTTIVAGYPWFGPWGRDALIALPGLYLASDFERAAAVLEALLAARVDGLIPNIPALGDFPANMSSVDASLLFARAVQWLGAHAGADRVERFMPGVCELLEAIADARDPRMRFDHGVGVWTVRGPWALTWMDAMVDGQPVTPRAGYAIEIDALAYNAARFATDWASAHRGTFARAFRTRLRGAEADFVRRYWDDTRGYLADGHDGERPDIALRPNQLFALGLPERAITGQMARASLEAVSRTLVVPSGLRTLDPGHPRYAGMYAGDQRDRDRSYHQGTAWPWLIGIYADAVLAVQGRAALEARLAPLLTFFAQHLDAQGCIGHVSEIFTAEPPHTPAGTPAQAWSVAEIFRALCMLQSGHAG